MMKTFGKQDFGFAKKSMWEDEKYVLIIILLQWYFTDFQILVLINCSFKLVSQFFMGRLPLFVLSWA